MMIKKMWRNRGKPPIKYDFDSCQKIEDVKGETKIDKIRLPLISKKSLHCLMKEDLDFLEEEAKQQDSARLHEAMSVKSNKKGKV